MNCGCQVFFLSFSNSLFHLSTREAAENDEDRDVQKETSVNVRVVSSQVSTYQIRKKLLTYFRKILTYPTSSVLAWGLTIIAVSSYITTDNKRSL